MDLRRSQLTQRLYEFMTAGLDPRYQVGLGRAPDGAGWSSGQPGVGTFVTYVTIGVLTAKMMDRQPVSGSRNSWIVGYQLRAVAIDPGQVDYVADDARVMLASAEKITVGIPEPWRITDVVFNSLGPVTRNDATDPPYWEVADDVALRIDRQRGA